MMVMMNNIVNDNTNNHHDYAEKVQKCQEYIGALEEERRKINVFQRELPLCLQLVTQTIEACKQQLTSSATTESNFHGGGQSECSEQISSHEGPVLEEFMPIKRASSSSSDYDDEHQSSKKPNNNTCNNSFDDKESKKSDWLRSAQLWNQTPDPTPKEDSLKKVKVMEVKRDESIGAFHQFKGEKISVETKPCGGSGDGKVVPVAVAASSSMKTGGSSGGSKKEDQKKHRRCWAPELHRKFEKALQQLGGPHVATPKQIRELMNVDGLTNDEVKSHLQKYRLHSRRPNPSHNNNTTTQGPQFVVVGGIWMPPPEYAATTAPASASGEASGAAIATAPPVVALRNKKSHSNSPASSSSDTTTASPPAY